jgi:hypothetical protein
VALWGRCKLASWWHVPTHVKHAQKSKAQSEIEQHNIARIKHEDRCSIWVQITITPYAKGRNDKPQPPICKTTACMV